MRESPNAKNPLNRNSRDLAEKEGFSRRDPFGRTPSGPITVNSYVKNTFLKNGTFETYKFDYVIPLDFNQLYPSIDLKNNSLFLASVLVSNISE
ncbi:hypothetical protein BH11BAC1_BH11BAC1_23880 [soil metagenome]